MIRILHYIGSLGAGGSQAMIMNIYRNIDRSKIQFDYVIEDRDDFFYKKEVESLGAKVFFCPDYNGKNHFEFMKWWDKFFCTHPEYHIFHCHVRSTSYLCVKTAKKYGLITISHSHSTSNGNGVYGIIKNIMQYPTRYTADYLFACSKEAGEWMFGRKMTKTGKYKIIKNSIDAKKYIYDPLKRCEIRDKLAITDQFVIGHVGRFMSVKNHDFLIRLYNEVQKSIPNSRLLLVGDGPLKSETVKKVKSLGLEKKVMFLGVRNDIPDLLQAMDVFVFPSLYEGLGIAVVEAQAAGLMTICSDRIPPEVNVTGKHVSLPLEAPIERWVNTVKKSRELKRENTYDSICKSGYDVADQVSKLEKFYLRNSR